MKLKFDVSTLEYNIIHSILVEYLNSDYKVWVFGSRAKNQTKYNSDLDLAIEYKTKINIKILRKIRNELEESKLAYKVDVLDLKAIDDNFKNIIQKDMILFPLNFLNKVPLLRFGEFSGEWEVKKLETISIIIMGQSPNSNSYNNKKEGVYLIQGNADIKNRKSKPRNWTNEPTKECKIGDLILTVRAPVGAIAKSLHDACIGRGVCAIRNNEHSHIEYLYQYLLWFESRWIALEQGSTFTAVSSSDIKSLKIPLPPLKEQTKISKFLTSIDTKIEQLTKKEKLLSTYKKGVMQKIFNQDIRFRDDGEWEEKEYGDIYSFYTTNSLSRDKLNYDNGTVKNIHYGDIHTKFNTMFNIQNEYVPFVNSNIDLSKIKEESYCLEGDLVIADASEDYMDIGKTMEIINLNDEKVIAGLHTFLARPNKYDIALGYMVYLLQSWEVRKQVMTIAQGTKVLSLSTKRLAKIKLNLPPLKEQTKIANFLSSIDKKIELVTQQLDALKAFKKALLQKMFV